MPDDLSENRKTPQGEPKGAMAHHITSTSNPQIKTLKSLHLKKGRAETGLFLAEGARLAVEAADLGVWPEILLFSPAALARSGPRADCAGRARRVRIETSESILAQISKRDNPQTVIGAYKQRLAPLELSGDTIVALVRSVFGRGRAREHGVAFCDEAGARVVRGIAALQEGARREMSGLSLKGALRCRSPARRARSS
ncbi:MAG: hypothetical protein IPG56_18870 [Caulobacteraceae bacterium]|nr:hypothetical protein [Caulobacteraceae bacterium]